MVSKVHDSTRPASDGIDLAHRAPLRLGTITVDPATRTVCGAGDVVSLRPRIMQVLLVLADARGAVVTRDEIAERCWSATFVAEDSITGAIAELRKALRSAGDEDVRIETVPKTGYRLVTPDRREERSEPALDQPGAANGSPDRRSLIAGGIAVAALAGFGGYRLFRPNPEPVTPLIDAGAQALRQGLPDANAQGIAVLTEATQRAPDDAKTWGMLALAWRAAAEYSGPSAAGNARAKAELAARRALLLDRRQSDGLTALATLTPAFGDWIAAERRLDEVLKVDPANPYAVAALATILMSTGQVRACLARLEWLNAQERISPNLQFRRVYTLWSAGRAEEADRVADRALQSWPLHPAVWFARFVTLAFTGRATAAGAMLNDLAHRPPLPAPAVRVLTASVDALGGKQAAVAAAVTANLEAAKTGPNGAVTAIMVLSELGRTDEAMAVARGFLVRRGPLVVQPRHTPVQASVTDQHHRMAMMLWVPSCRALRLHPGFPDLCDGVGLTEYWRATARRPDEPGALNI